MVKPTQEPAWNLKLSGASVTVVVELPLVQKSSEIDAYVSDGVLEVEVEDVYSLKVPLPCAIVDEELACRFKKKDKKLTITIPVVAQQPDTAALECSPAENNSAAKELKSQPEQPVPSIANVENAITRQVERKPAAEREEVNDNGMSSSAAVAKEENKSVGEESEDLDWVPPEIKLAPQEGMEELQELSEGVRTATFTDGVSDFNIFRHNLGKEFDAIYAATRASLPSIETDHGENEDGDEDVEVLNASEQLEALTRRTYETLEAKGLRLTPAAPADA